MLGLHFSPKACHSLLITGVDEILFCHLKEYVISFLYFPFAVVDFVSLDIFVVSLSDQPWHILSTITFLDRYPTINVCCWKWGDISRLLALYYIPRRSYGARNITLREAAIASNITFNKLVSASLSITRNIHDQIFCRSYLFHRFPL